MRVVIDAPPKQVWDDIRHIERHAEWMGDAQAIRFLTDQREGVGTVFDADTKVGPFRLVDRMEVVEWRPPKVQAIAHRGIVSGTGRFTLRRARGGRTKFTWGF